MGRASLEKSKIYQKNLAGKLPIERLRTKWGDVVKNDVEEDQIGRLTEMDGRRDM